MDNQNNTQPVTNMESFIGKLKKEDKRLQKDYNFFKKAHIILTIVFFLSFLLLLILGENILFVKYGCLLLGALILTVIFTFFRKRFSKINYSDSTLHLLKETVKRYRISIGLKEVLLFIGWSFIMFGFIITEEIHSIYVYIKNSDLTLGSYIQEYWNTLVHLGIESWAERDKSIYPGFGIIIPALCLFLVYIISVFSSCFMWRKRFKPIRDNAIALIEEIES